MSGESLAVLVALFFIASLFLFYRGHRTREAEQPSRLPILGGGSPPSVNCPVLDGKHIRCRGR